MQFSAKVEDVHKALNIVKGTFGSKSFPALNNIFFEADQGEVLLRSSNGHETTTTKFPARVTTPGNVLIDGYTITRIVSTFADGDLEIVKHPGLFSVDVNHPTGSLEIAGTDPGDFVEPVQITEQSSFMIPSKEFKEALGNVSFARAINHSNAKLNGVAIIVDNGRTSLYACDTTRVAKYTFDTPAADDINIVVPPEVVSGLSAVSGNIAVRLSDKGIIFENNDTVYQSGILGEDYPPSVNSYFLMPEYASLLIDKEQLKDTLTRVSIMSKAGKDEPHAKFLFKQAGELEIQFRGTRGRIKSEIVKTNHTGPDVELTFSVDKVLQSLKIMEKDTIQMVFPQGKGDIVSATMYPEGSKDYGVFNMGVKS